ncbi:MAG TPA: hypothetical protein PLF73_11555, partial [Luteimonas sp.]|nr:hypothetical protein [Luteimonas sp.]
AVDTASMRETRPAAIKAVGRAGIVNAHVVLAVDRKPGSGCTPRQCAGKQGLATGRAARHRTMREAVPDAAARHHARRVITHPLPASPSS